MFDNTNILTCDTDYTHELSRIHNLFDFHVNIHHSTDPRNNTKCWVMREYKFARNDDGRVTAKWQRDVIVTTEFDNKSEQEVIEILSERVYMNWSYYFFPQMGT